MTATQNTTFWQNAYQLHAPKMLGLCRRYVSERSIAEDLMHDAFVTAIQKQHTFANKGSFEGWLARVTVNTVLMYLRKVKTTFNQSIDNLDISDGTDNDEFDNFFDAKSQILHADFDKESLLFAIDSLPIHHKTVFNLYVFEQYSHQQIGEALQISAGTSKSHLARARKKIQVILLQKVTEMKKKEKKMAFTPFFYTNKDSQVTTKENFIDDLCKQKLSDFSIAPMRSSLDFQKLLQQSTPPPLPPSSSIFLTKKIFLLLSSVVIVSSIVVYVHSNTAKKDSNMTINQSTELSNTSSNVQNLSEDTKEKDNVKLLFSSSKNMEQDTNKKKDSVAMKSKQKKQSATPIPTLAQNENTEIKTIVVKKQIVKKDTLFK